MTTHRMRREEYRNEEFKLPKLPKPKVMSPKEFGKALYKFSGVQGLVDSGKALAKCKPKDSKCIASNLGNLALSASSFVPGAGVAGRAASVAKMAATAAKAGKAAAGAAKGGSVGHCTIALSAAPRMPDPTSWAEHGGGRGRAGLSAGGFAAGHGQTETRWRQQRAQRAEGHQRMSGQPRLLAVAHRRRPSARIRRERAGSGRLRAAPAAQRRAGCDR